MLPQSALQVHESQTDRKPMALGSLVSPLVASMDYGATTGMIIKSMHDGGTGAMLKAGKRTEKCRGKHYQCLVCGPKMLCIPVISWFWFWMHRCKLHARFFFFSFGQKWDGYCQKIFVEHGINFSILMSLFQIFTVNITALGYHILYKKTYSLPSPWRCSNLCSRTDLKLS
jgi:hypothetical protein